MFSVRTKIIMRVKLTSTLLRQGACVRGGSIISVFVQRLRSKTWTYESNVFCQAQLQLQLQLKLELRLALFSNNTATHPLKVYFINLT